MKLHVKKGDTVMVIAGEDKGKTGKVLKVYPEKNRAIVEGRNLVKKHTKPSAKNTQGGIVEQEAPIHLSKHSRMKHRSAGRRPTLMLSNGMEESPGFWFRIIQKRQLSNGPCTTRN